MVNYLLVYHFVCIFTIKRNSKGIKKEFLDFIKFVQENAHSHCIFKERSNYLDVYGDVLLDNTQIKQLPAYLKVNGYLDLSYSRIRIFPNDVHVTSNLDLSGCTLLKSLSDNLIVKGNLYLSESAIETLPTNLRVGADLILYRTAFSDHYPSDIREMIELIGGYVGGKIYTN